MTRKIEVEVVVCGSCSSLDVHPSGMCVKCGYCLGSGDRETASIAPGTYSEAMYRLAEACVRLVTVGDSVPEKGEHPERTCERYDAAVAGYEQALAVVRSFAPEAP